MKYLAIFGLVSIIIFLLKLPETAGLHFTDANNYIYIASLLEHGKLLYKDIYLDNFPLMMYISILYRWITFGSMQWFNMTSTVEKIAISLLLYKIAMRFWKKQSTALLVSLTFLCSYTVLSNSFQLGFYTSILCIIAAYYVSLDKRYWLAGILASAAVLIKAYSLFPVIALFVSMTFQDRWKSYGFTVAGIGTALLVMMPTLLFAFPQFIAQTFGFGLVRGALETKTDLYINLVQYDFLVFLLVIWNLTLWKKNLFVALGTVLLCLFFLFYRDVYYIYFSYFPLFAALGAGYLLETPLPWFHKKFPLAIYGTLFAFAVFFSFVTYITTDRFLDEIPDSQKLLNKISDQHPSSLYGYSYVTNGIAYLTAVPPYNNEYDITATGFANANINRTEYTEKVVASKGMIIVDNIQTPEAIIYDNSIMDTDVIKKDCKKTYSHLVKLDTNSRQKRYLTLFDCR